MGTREKILEASINLFAEYGYTETSMRMIAKQADIKSSSIYNHFASKAEILGVILRLYIDTTAERAISMEELEGLLETEDARTIIHRMFYVYEEAEADRYIRIHKIIIHEQYREPIAQEFVKNVLFIYNRDYIGGVLTRLKGAGRISPNVSTGIYANLFNSVLVAASVEALHYGLVEYQQMQGGDTFDKTLDYLIDQIMQTR